MQQSLLTYDHVFQKCFFLSNLLQLMKHSQKTVLKKTGKAKLKIHSIYGNLSIKF